MLCSMHSVDVLITPEPAQYAVGREGEDVTISCIPSVNTTVLWQRDSMQINADGVKYTFSPPDMDHTLTINSVTTSDSGIYTCSPSVASETTVRIQVIVINGMCNYIHIQSLLSIFMYMCLL